MLFVYYMLYILIGHIFTYNVRYFSKNWIIKSVKIAMVYFDTLNPTDFLNCQKIFNSIA